MLQSIDAAEQAKQLLDEGNALLLSNQPADALASYDQALRIRPGSAAVLTNRSNALRALRRLDEALRDLDAALAVRPAFPEALNNRGNVLRDMRRPREALASFDAALALRPEFILARCNRGSTLLDLGRHQEALECFETALAQAPEDAEALFGRAVALLNLRLRLEEAVQCFDRAAAFGLDRVECLVGRSAALNQLKRHGEAAQSLREVVALAPDRPHVLGSLLHSRLQGADWSDHAALVDAVVTRLNAGHAVAYPLSLLPVVDSPELSLMSARIHSGEQVLSDELQRPVAGARRGRVRIAYISGDFRDHPVAHLLVGVLEQHDRQKFEVLGVSLGGERTTDEIGPRINAAFDEIIDATSLSDPETARLLRERQVDIAIDLMGFTDGCRPGIFANRAAPVQVNYLGYPGTVGAPHMDYLLADEVVIPREAECWYTEKVIRLPDCILPNDDRRPVGPAPSRAQAGLPQQGVVFCAFTSAHKINPPVFDVWMRLLREVPGSVLWLRELGSEAQGNLLREAAARGVEAQRLVFAPRVAGMAEHLGRHQLADLYLDTSPYNAHSTACDALWAGVPVLTCTGRTFAARVATSVLTAVGLPELITKDLQEYENRALQLARAPQRLQVLRDRLAREGKRSALFDTRAYCRNLEQAYLGMMHDSRQ